MMANNNVQTNPHEPAFPNTWEEEQELGMSGRSYKYQLHDKGVSKLEYIATKALQGYLSCDTEIDPEYAAKKAVRYAKALIVELNLSYQEERDEFKRQQEEYRKNHPDELD